LTLLLGGVIDINKKCVALSQEEYQRSIELLRNGFMLSGVLVKPNERIATIEVLQATLGLRLGDILKLKLSSFIRDGDRYRLDIREEKTGKIRNFTVPNEVYSFVQDYCIEGGISKDAKLFDISKRQVERHLNKVFMKMELPLRSYGSHSYRKFFATKVYTDSEFNAELVRVLLQHSSLNTTQRYLSIGTKQIEDALARTVSNLI
jgi:integrase